MLSPATSTVTDPAPLQGTEPATVDLATEGDRESITDVHGTVARFEMSYSPKVGERLMFGPPLRMRIPSFVYLAGAVALIGTVIAAHLGSSNSRLYVWVVEGDKNRPLGALTLSLLILVSAIYFKRVTWMCRVAQMPSRSSPRRFGSFTSGSRS